jgi:2-phosphoglycerate kinase
MTAPGTPPEGGRTPPEGRSEVVVVRSDYGLPYSKGLMAQSIMATGLAPERAFELARLIERRLEQLGRAEVGVEELRELAEEVLHAEEGAALVTRFHQWWRLGGFDRPLVILIGGVTGVGKSTVATQLANRLAITRVIATDQIRQVVRAFFSNEFMPAVHHSSFDVGRAIATRGEPEEQTVAGFLRQVSDIAPGIDALVDRAVSERSRIVIEGVHLLPEVPNPELRERALTVEVLLAVEDEQAHRGHFHMRGLQSPRPPERYLEAFDRIRELQRYLIDRARAAGIAIVDAGGLEATLKRVQELVLDAVVRREDARIQGSATVHDGEGLPR